MLIDPRVAIREGWVTGITNEEKQVQPNAIDFTIDTVFTIDESSTFSISEDGKQMRGRSKLVPLPDRRGGPSFWRLAPNSAYDCLSNVYVNLPEGVAVLPLVARSSFTRNAVFLISGLYDSGFQGHLGFILHNRSGIANVAVGTRIGQVIFVESDSAGLYAGQYNHEAGTIAPHQAD